MARFPTPESSRSNRYLRWLEGSAPPQVRGSLGKAEEAAQILVRRLRNACRAMSRPGAGWSQAQALMGVRQQIDALLYLVENQAEVSRRMGFAAAVEWVQDWQKRMGRMDEAMGEGRVGKVIRRLKARSDCPIRRHAFDMLLSGSEKNGSAIARLRRDAFVQQQREERSARDREAKGGVWLIKRPTGLHRDYVREARQAAAKRGGTGYLLVPNTDSMTAALKSCDPEIRRLAWAEDFHAPVPMAAVERTRRRRHDMARMLGHASFASYTLHEYCVIRDPQTILRGLQQARQILRRDVQSYSRAAEAKARREGDEVGDIQAPWNLNFVIDQAEPDLYLDTSDIFPWKETAIKVFTELCKATGWRFAQSVRISGEGIWTAMRFQLIRSDGAEAYLIYAPFRPHQKGESYSAGHAVHVVNHWRPDGSPAGAPVVWINQTLDISQGSFSLENLRILCHEIGHALHFLALPGIACDTDICEDVVEIPSCLLELYMRDPVVLARWAAPKGPAAARRSRFWKNKLRWPVETAVDHLESLRGACVDLLAHIEQDRSFQEICQSVLSEDGHVIFEEDSSWRRNFVWEQYLAGIDFTQIVSRSVVRRLVTVPDHGCVNADLIAAAYRNLIQHVLAPGYSREITERRWKAWAGESFRTTVRESLMAYARQSSRLARRGATRLRRQGKGR